MVPRAQISLGKKMKQESTYTDHCDHEHLLSCSHYCDFVIVTIIIAVTSLFM